ncbi:metallophosphoesterase family protein [Deinococcus aquiradiocola]|uniref:Phosphoesterase n=1 Tax=Deinococcus aquiradiocola TaxID=393059 RepID=A0A917P6N6_9DEIO|nr:metallophosphoesterase family protein [Deinococcus aquiradiocola]GGJ64251.1 phosphoesterase [Deinococcus aquiradiocola]
MSAPRPAGHAEVRLAVFGDVHGNLPALEAALADMRRHAPDALLCLGDVATGGPWTRECLQAVAQLGCPVVLGNADEDLLHGSTFVPRGFPDERAIWEIGEWNRAQLNSEDLRVLGTFQGTVTLPGLLAYHGSPASCREALGPDTPPERLAQLREAYPSVPDWVGGHTHTATLRTLDGWRLLNPGSVGLPFERRGNGYVNVSRAEYLLLDRPGDRPGTVQFRRVTYDVRAVQDGIRRSGMPHAEWLAREWVQD